MTFAFNNQPLFHAIIGPSRRETRGQEPDAEDEAEVTGKTLKSTSV